MTTQEIISDIDSSFIQAEEVEYNNLDPLFFNYMIELVPNLFYGELQFIPWEQTLSYRIKKKWILNGLYQVITKDTIFHNDKINYSFSYETFLKDKNIILTDINNIILKQ